MRVGVELKIGESVEADAGLERLRRIGERDLGSLQSKRRRHTRVRVVAPVELDVARVEHTVTRSHTRRPRRMRTLGRAHIERRRRRAAGRVAQLDAKQTLAARVQLGQCGRVFHARVDQLRRCH